MRQRRVALERELTKTAARLASVDSYIETGRFCDPTALIEHAETRAHDLSSEYTPDPLLVREDRDRPHDVREELADGRNHLVWWLEANPDHPLYPKRLLALGVMTLAYELMQD